MHDTDAHAALGALSSGLRSGSEACLRLLAHADDLVAVRAHPNERDRGPGVVGYGLEVLARLLRQVLLAATVADIGLEAGQLLVLRLDGVDDRLVVGELVEDGAVGVAVAGA